jgi:hypothetical protein
MELIRTFCTNKTSQVSTGVYEIEVVLRRGMHDAQIASYGYAYDSVVDTGNPELVVLDATGESELIRLKTEQELLPPLIQLKKSWLTQRMDEILDLGGVVLPDTKNFRMKTHPEDQQSMMIGLNSFKRQIAKNGLDPATATAMIRDYDNQYHACTVAEWEQIIADMEDHGVLVWTTKCQKQAMCDAATTMAELDSIVW